METLTWKPERRAKQQREWVAWVAFCIRLAERELNTSGGEVVGDAER